ncbi:MAG: DUF1285 domain-containing protein [Alphaproteobacteria bacterium]
MTKTGPGDPKELANILQAGKAVGKSRDGPTDCGHFNIRIARDGKWYYRGSPIDRKPLVKLFSSVLMRDRQGQFWLQTPVEKGRIDVEDTPFVAVEMAVSGAGRGQQLRFRTNLDEWVRADGEHPINVVSDERTQEPSPYVRVRDNMDALIARSVFYDLVALGVEDGDAQDHMLRVWSGGVLFELGMTV